jgi:hypothetical protein
MEEYPGSGTTEFYECICTTERLAEDKTLVELDFSHFFFAPMMLSRDEKAERGVRTRGTTTGSGSRQKEKLEEDNDRGRGWRPTTMEKTTEEEDES